MAPEGELLFSSCGTTNTLPYSTNFCTWSYPDGTIVTLTPVPNAGVTFNGWSGVGCTGTGPCVVTLTQPESVTATFSDATPPVVNITAPAPGASVSGSIPLSASPTDNVGVVGVQFQLDGVALGGEDTTAPFGITWDTTSVADGVYILTAIARDSENSTTSPQVSVTVNNTQPETVSFQNGVDGYTGTVNTLIRGATPDTPGGNAPEIGWITGESKSGLVSFENLFDTEGGPIPSGATITSATLTIEVFNDGDAANIYEVAVDWVESVTFNQFGEEPDVQQDEPGALISAAAGTVSIGALAVDVTASLQAWSTMPNENHGWIIMPAGTNAVRARSSEHGTVTLRPRLEVTYLN